MITLHNITKTRTSYPYRTHHKEFQETPEDRRSKLEMDLQTTRASAYAKGTLKNLACQWRAFRCFSISINLFQWPVSEHTLCLFAQFLAYSFHSVSLVKNYLVGIKTIHVLCKARPPNLSNIEVRLTLMGLNKTMVNVVKQAEPITPEILLDIVVHLDLTKRMDLVFWGVLVVGFFTFFRKSNLVPDAIDEFNPLKQPTKGSIRFENMLVLISTRWTKTIQFKQRQVETPLFEIQDSPLCPLKTLRALVALPGRRNHPLFALKGGIPFTYNMLQNKLKAVLKKAGYDATAFSSHSIRRGAVLWAYRSGVPESLIKVQGDWLTDCYKRDMTFPLEVRAVVNLKMCKAISSRVLHF